MALYVEINDSAKCIVCEHTYGTHYTTHDKGWSGCSDCNECQGFLGADDD